MGTGDFNTAVNSLLNQHPNQGGVEITPVTSCYSNEDNFGLVSHLAPIRQYKPYLSYMYMYMYYLKKR